MSSAPFDPKNKFFPHEKLEAYQLARAAVQFVAARKAKLRGLPGQAGPQLERAVVGAHTNLCAAAANEAAEARRYYRIAISEASEAGGAADLAFDFGAISSSEHTELRTTLLRLCATLTGLSRR